MTSVDSRTDDKTANSILVAVDFSPAAAAALKWAVGFAKRTRQPLLILHVVHAPATDPGYYAPPVGPEALGLIEEAAETMLDDFLAAARRDHPDLSEVTLEARLVAGVPVPRILEVAESSAACHIVMGSQGRTGLPHFLLGSKAERIVQLAPMPVTIVKAPSADNSHHEDLS